jgi:hypothetical protein
VEQILGFEDARLWRASEAVRLSPVHSEGAFSLAVRPSRLAVVRSASFALAPSTLRQLAIDLMIPGSADPTAAAARAGHVGLALASRSRGVLAVVGVADLTGRPTGAFTTIELDVPAEVARRLGGGADDLRVLVLLDAPRGREPYLLDNLRLRSELILHYSFDVDPSGAPSDGTVPDRSGYGRNAALRGAAAITADGRTGGALALDGNTAYLELPANLTDGVDELTVAAWIDLDETRGWSRLFDFGGANGFVFLTPSTPDALIRYSAFAGPSVEGIATAPSIPTGVWKHVAVTTTGRDYRLYVDGIEAANVLTIPVVPADIGANNGGNWIGRSRFPDPLLRGRVDDFRIYRRALAQDEIAALAQPQRDYASWRLDDHRGSIVADSSELGLSGAIVGGASFGRGLIGNAMTLAGSGQYVALPPGIVAGCTDFTMAAWVKLRTNRPWNRVFDFGAPDFSSFMYLSPAGFGASGQELRFGLVSPRGISDVGFPFQLPLGRVDAPGGDPARRHRDAVPQWPARGPARRHHLASVGHGHDDRQLLRSLDVCRSQLRRFARRHPDVVPRIRRPRDRAPRSPACAGGAAAPGRRRRRCHQCPRSGDARGRRPVLAVLDRTWDPRAELDRHGDLDARRQRIRAQPGVGHRRDRRDRLAVGTRHLVLRRNVSSVLRGLDVRLESLVHRPCDQGRSALAVGLDRSRAGDLLQRRNRRQLQCYRSQHDGLRRWAALAGLRQLLERHQVDPAGRDHRGARRR